MNTAHAFTLAAMTVLVEAVGGCASYVLPADPASHDVAPHDATVADVVDALRSFDPVEGYIEAVTRIENGVPAASSVDAHFYRVDPLHPCRTEVADGCRVRHCDRGDGGGPTFEPVSAGEIRVTDSTRASAIVLPFRASGMDYASDPLGNDYWPAHAALEFQASGDVVRAFRIPATFPSATALVGFMPEYDDRSVVVDRSRDLSLRWSPPFAVGSVAVTVSVTTLDGSVEIVCYEVGSRGAMTITTAQLAHLPATGPDAGFIDIAAVDDRLLMAYARSGEVDQTIYYRAGYELFAASAGTR
jgi:hypothetical protein